MRGFVSVISIPRHPRAEAAPTAALAVGAGAAVGATLADQISKAVAVTRLLDGPVDGPGPFWFRLVANRGAFMGFPLPGWVLLAAVIGIAAVAIHSLLQPSTRVVAIGWGLVVGGALGNLVDRVQHRPRFPDHAVVDWIASPFFPTFNLADLTIVAGLLLIATSRAAGNDADAAAKHIP